MQIFYWQHVSLVDERFAHVFRPFVCVFLCSKYILYWSKKKWICGKFNWFHFRMQCDCCVFMRPQNVLINRAAAFNRKKHKLILDTYKWYVWVLYMVCRLNTHTYTHRIICFCAICGAFDWIHLKRLFGNRKCMERKRVQFIDRLPHWLTCGTFCRLVISGVSSLEGPVFIFMANSRNKRTETHVITINFHLRQIACA